MKPEILIWKHNDVVRRYELGTHATHSLDELGRWLQPYARDSVISIDPRQGVTVQDVVTVMDRLRREGFRDLSFAGTSEQF
ncbi:MAG: hypothetical protein O3A20_03715 [Planctomycetota bacterium]|nr:hypothetical protein [Planctomycetota bacterium]